MAKSKGKRQDIKQSDLRGFKYFDNLWPLLGRLQDVGTDRDKAGNRKLFFDQYVLSLLLYFFNPVLTSMRGLQQASDLDKVQKALGIKHLSLGSLSECTQVFSAEPLREIVVELAGRVAASADSSVSTGSIKSKAVHQALQGLTAVDGTLIHALPRMMWALWLDDNNRAAKMHLQFDVLKSIPCDATLTTGNGSEIQAAREMLQPGRLYVMDRGYVGYRWFREILDAKSSFVTRVKTNTAFTVDRELPLNKAAREAGISRDVIISKLGASHHKDEIDQPLRLVMVETTKADGTPTTLWLLTDRLGMASELVALAYQYRWSIELFFRWFKCILGCRHLLSENESGVSIQCYTALIASLLISLLTNLKPTKRTWEMVQYYLTGWATLEELETHLRKRRDALIKGYT